MKKILFWMVDFLKIPSLYLKTRKPVATIILYHGVSPTLNKVGVFNYRKKFISPENFRKQIFWLRRYFNIVPLSTIVELAQNKKSLSVNTLAITFDDGYENIYENAFPILKEFRIPATIFVTTDLVDKREPLWIDRLEYAIGHTTLNYISLEINDVIRNLPTDNFYNKCRTDMILREYLKNIANEEKEGLLLDIEKKTGKNLMSSFSSSPYQGLTWKQMQEMANFGIDFAPHTNSHPILSKISPEKAGAEIYESLNLMSQKLKRVIKIFAYPNGQKKDFDPEIINILKKYGFVAALTTIPGTIKETSDVFSLPRFSLDESDNLRFFRLTVTGIRNYMQLMRDALRVKSVDPGIFFNKDIFAYLAEYYKDTPEGFSFRERKRLTLDLLKNIRNKNVLDIGSGPGIITEELLRRGAIVTAIDIAPNMIKLLKKRFQHTNLTAKIGNIENIEGVRNQLYDYIIALGVLEYLETDKKALSEISRLLKEGGETIISFPNCYSPWRIWNKLLLIILGLPWRIFKNLTGRNKHPVKHREYTQKQIRETAAMANLKVLEFIGYNFKLIPLPLDRIFPKLTIKLSQKLKSLGKANLKWLATAYLVRLKKS